MKIASKIVALLILLLAQLAWANPQLITISAIKVNETARSATEARDKAIAKGERKAFNKLVGQHISPSELYRLRNFTDEDITRSIQGYEVADEKVTAASYQAQLTFTFYRKALEELLMRENIQLPFYAEPPAIILPLYEFGERMLLWENDNIWKSAWQDVIDENDSGQITVLPLGDMDDRQQVDVETVMAQDYTRLKPLIQRYNASDILIASAVLTERKETSQYEVTVKLQAIGESVVPSKEVSYVTDSLTPPLQFLRYAAKDMLLHLEDYRVVKKQSDERGLMLPVVVPIDGLQDWMYVKQRLELMPGIKEIKVEQLTPKLVELFIYHTEQLPTLRAGFEAMDLRLQAHGNAWLLQPVR